METSYPNLSSLPVELHEQILLDLPPRSILNFCSTSKEFNLYCKDDGFWQVKAKKDYQATDKPSRYPLWFDFYKGIHIGEIVNIKIAKRGEIIGSIWVENYIRIGEFADEVVPIFGSRPQLLYFIRYDGLWTFYDPDFEDDANLHIDDLIAPNDLLYVEASDNAEELVKILHEGRLHFFWYGINSSPVGEFIDFIRKINPDTLIITFRNIDGDDVPFRISDDPTKRAELLRQFFEEIRFDYETTVLIS